MLKQNTLLFTSGIAKSYKFCRPNTLFCKALSTADGFLTAKDFSAIPPKLPSAQPYIERNPVVGVTETTAVPVVGVTDYLPPPPIVTSIPPIKLGINLSKYGVNLNKSAADGKLEVVVGRDDEIRKAMQILSRRRKNNPCLIGDPGVGKTAIVEGLARLINAGDVPENMKDKVIVSLDLAGMLAGTKFRGEFEERLKGVLKDIEQCGDRIILFIDELHIIVGAGGSEGAIDASNILKPSLARGQLRCLGATTTEEYSRHIEKDAALARRFQPVYVAEPTEEETVRILQGVRDQYELHHKVQITDEAISTAVKLAGRYITTRKFPDKAIDLIDEAASRIRNRLESQPAEVAELNAKIAALEPLIHSLKHMNSRGTNEREMGRLVALRNKIDGEWRGRTQLISNIFELRKDVFRLQEEYRLNKHSALAAHYKDRQTEITNLIEGKRKIISSLCESLPTVPAAANSSDNIAPAPQCNMVSGQDLAEVVAQTTGIPVSTMLDDSERASLLTMEAELRKRIIGQNEAISAIAKCIRLSRAGLRYHDRPLGVFLMLGPTGVGKTELAKCLSDFLFKSQTSMTRIDMSEYMEKFSVSRLIGAPPGYVGYEEGGVLTDAIRKRPYQVILLDEFEKAHREVSNLLLQVFDEGRLTDSQGRVVDFRNTVIIMTSNLGTDLIRNADETARRHAEEEAAKEGEKMTPAQMSRSSAEFKTQLVSKLVNQHFSPEFVNRLDDIVTFNPLELPAITRICDIQLEKVSRLLRERDVTLEVTAEVKEWVSERSSGTGYGARPLKRLIQSALLNPLASLLLENKVVAGDTVKATLADSTADSVGSDYATLQGDSEQLSGSPHPDILFSVLQTGRANRK